MSGVKTFPIMAGAAPVVGATLIAAGGAVLATGAVVAGGMAVATLTTRAVQSHQERARREQKAAQAAEQKVQQKIAEVRSAQTMVTLASGSSSTPVSNAPNQRTLDTAIARRQAVIAQDTQRSIQNQKQHLHHIKAEYQNLIEHQLLDAKIVEQALLETERALDKNQLAVAQTRLQALDEARIQAIHLLKTQWLDQVDYLQSRLDEIRLRLPTGIVEHLSSQIQQARLNWRTLTHSLLETIHQQITEVHLQADRIQEAATHLLRAWTEVGYTAQMVGIEQGDAVIEVDTEAGKTQMRIQFDGQQLNFSAPSEETLSCAARTREALQRFQEQGYYLEWDTLDGEAVPQEWRKIYSALPPGDAVEEQAIAPTQQTPQRRAQSQGA
jgi:hypothetical protein